MISVDISETVIQQMIKQYSTTHPGIQFMTLDLLKMNFDAETFSCFLDKGTLDALMSDNDSESKSRAENMFKVQDRFIMSVLSI